MREQARFAVLSILLPTLLTGCADTLTAMSAQFRQGYQAQVAYQDGVQLYERGDYSGAIPDLQRAVELDPAADDAEALLAWSYYYVRRYPDALLHFRRAIERQPQWAGLYDGLGWTRYQLGRYHIALDAFQQSLQLSPSDRDAALGYAFSLFELGRYAEALPRLERLTRDGEASVFRKAATDLEEVRSRYAWTLFYRGEYDRARTEFAVGIAAHPQWFGLQNGLGWTLLRLREPAPARAHFLEALELRPGYPDAMEGLAQVRLLSSQQEPMRVKR